MIYIKTVNNQISEADDLIKDESDWLNLDNITCPIRSAGFNGIGEITVSQVKNRIQNRVNDGQEVGQIDFPPKIHHDQSQDEFRFLVLWKYVEEEAESDPNLDSGESP